MGWWWSCVNEESWCKLTVARVVWLLLLSSTVYLLWGYGWMAVSLRAAVVHINGTTGSGGGGGGAPHFCLISTVYNDARDPLFLVPRITAFKSLAQQRHSSWTLFLGGDGLKPSTIGALFVSVAAANVSMERVVFRNMDYKRREARLFANLPPDHLYRIATVNVNSMVLGMIESTTYCTNVAHWDADDVYLPNHLETLADAYVRFPTAAFVYTSFRKNNDATSTWPMYATPAQRTLYLNNYRPTVSDCPHPTWSWKLALLRGMRLRSYDQMALAGDVTPPPFQDADLLNRLNAGVFGVVDTLFVDTVTAVYSDDKDAVRRNAAREQ